MKTYGRFGRWCRIHLLSGAGGVLLSMQSALALNLELPDLGDVPAHASASSRESKLGLQAVRKLRGRLPVIEDAELNSWLQNLGQRLAARAGYSGTVYFLLVDNPDVNAFASIGGVIVVYSGLVLQADSEDEVAAVMAHEIAHLSQRHIQRMMADAKGSAIGTGAAVVAGLLAGTQDPQAGQAIVTTALAAAQQKQLNYSRSMETEADSVGIRTLSAAGYDPYAMPSFMEKLDRIADQYPARLSKFLQSHPLSIERVANTRSRADQLGRRNRQSPGFAFIKAKLRVVTTRGVATSGAAGRNPQLGSYEKGLGLSRSGKYAQAQPLLDKAGGSLAARLAQAENHYQLRQYQQSIKLLKPLLSRYYGEEQVIIPLANQYVALGQPSEAWNLLRKLVPAELTSLEYFDARQEAARLMGLTGEAYLAAAERNVRVGNYRHARIQLHEALRLPNLNPAERAQIQRRMDEIKEFDRSSEK